MSSGGALISPGSETSPTDCGSEALVEYVCIDTFNPETGFWEEWGCGYVTTC
jgi:hypothetical protein